MTTIPDPYLHKVARANFQWRVPREFRHLAHRHTTIEFSDVGCCEQHGENVLRHDTNQGARIYFTATARNVDDSALVPPTRTVCDGSKTSVVLT